MRKTVLLVAFLLVGSCVQAIRAEEQQQNQTAQKLDVQVRVTLDYLLYLPPNYDKMKTAPLLLFLHGGGERGHDINLVKRHGPPKLIAEGKQFPFIVVSPQCPADAFWQPLELTALLDYIEAHYRVDPDRVYVTGLSMGGYGTWMLAAYTPNRFAALVPICGGGEKFWAELFPHVAVWVFHGAKDDGVPVARAQAMVDALVKNGGNVKFTVYPDEGHRAWIPAYNDPALYAWLLEQKRQPPKPKMNHQGTKGTK